MQRKSFDKMPCPIARSLERVGEWWSMLIMRDALHGMTRFDEFQKSLGIAPNMLTRRLNALVEAGSARTPPLQRASAAPRLCADRARPRSSSSFSFRCWPGATSISRRKARASSSINRKTGAAVDPILADPATGRPVDEPDYTLAAGPAAGPRTRQRYGAMAARRHRRETRAGRRKPTSKARSK